MKSLKTLTLIAFLGLFSVVVRGQSKDIVFEQITNESGRSLGFITGIVQDQTGFMWFATRNGLYRYNGYSYKLFKKNPNDSLSLPQNDIAYLYYDNHQNFWMRHYDELSAFKDEKRVYDFDSIIGKNFNIEVKIVQDSKDNYWIGPTNKGLLKYNPSSKTLNTFHCPPKSYSTEAWKKFDTLLKINTCLATITSPGNNVDTAVHFTITKAGYYMVASSGEIDKYGKYDFGALYHNKKLIWELSNQHCMWAGNEDKNVFESKPLKLDPGDYTLTYKSDMSNSCGHWDGKGPDRIEFCGTRIIEISKNDFNEIDSKYLTPYRDSTFIESEQIKDMLIDNNGNFWALTDKGLEKYNYKKHRFDHFPINFSEILRTDITNEYLRFYRDKEGIFWIGSMYGLIKYDILWGRSDLFQNDNKNEVLTSNVIYSIFEDNNSNIWIGTDKGLTIYNKETKIRQKITADNHNRLYSNKIVKIFEDHSGNIWVATFEGLNRLIKDPFTYTNLGFEASNEYPVIYDEAANIWYAIGDRIAKYSRTFQNKLEYKLPDKLFNYNDFTGDLDYIIEDMVKSPDDQIWVATDNKISRFNIYDKKVDYTAEAYAIIVGSDSIKNVVKQLLIGKTNKLYAFCPNGMYIWNTSDLTRENFYPFKLNYEFIDEVNLNYFKSARFDKKGDIWIRTSVGFYEFNPQLGKMDLVFEFDDEFKNGPLSGGKFDFDKKGNVWFATLPYIYSLNIESHETKKWQCKFDHEWAVGNVKVGRDTVYVYGKGLYMLNPESGEIDFASVENGIAIDDINGVEEDNLGYLWLTESAGLTKYDPVEKKSKNFFTKNDFTSYEFLGNPQNFRIPTSEKILFTTDGFVSFYPDSINRIRPNVVIDRFTIRGKDVDVDSLIYYKKTLNLTYKQNFLGFEFAVLDYTDPSENHYRYMLKGLDEEWITADANNRRANYSGIAPGKYKFIVQGSNNDKIWNRKGAQISILISPPWYKTTLAYIIYVLLITASIWLFITIRERNLKEEKRILEQKVRERTAEIEAQKEELATQNAKISEQHKNITDSIQYAQRIQAAILPPIEKIKEVVDDYFVLYRPRDIVSGDYYWSTRRDDITIIVAADCTGHGVPGAFMSMLGIAFLNEIVNKEGIVQPDEILNRLRNQVITQLHQTGNEGESKDGMDISLYVIDHKNMKLRFAGAYNPLFVIRNDEVIQLKADRMPIGYYFKKETNFSMEEIDLLKGDCLYNSSDGYPDQFGGPDERKFMTKNFKDLLLQIYKKPMAEQRQILDRTIDEWRGKIEQIDDIVVIGVRV